MARKIDDSDDRRWITATDLWRCFCCGNRSHQQLSFAALSLSVRQDRICVSDVSSRPYLNVRDNVRMGQLEKDTAAIEEMLKQLGLKSRAESFPSMLSGREQQRTALARAMIHRPAVIFADEPTGNLDPENGTRVLELLDQYRKDGGPSWLFRMGRTSKSMRTVS
ncbi:MAG: ATP-binding cassette domain-containing protein [Planctomycetaceae bacterium]